MERIKVKIKVRAKDESKLPDWVLGKGILAEQEVILGETPTEANKIRLALKLEEIYNNLLETTLEKVIEVENEINKD